MGAAEVDCRSMRDRTMWKHHDQGFELACVCFDQHEALGDVQSQVPPSMYYNTTD